MAWRISSAGPWKPYRWRICQSLPAIERVEEDLQHGNEWTDKHVRECLPVSEGTNRKKNKTMYHIYIATTLLSLLS